MAMPAWNVDKAGVTQSLPIDDALPDLIAALRDAGQAVLEAPPGAGKTTRVPLALLEAGLTQGRVLMLEPRRLAARAAAARMAETLGEPLGQTVGYRIRGEKKTSANTRIEVVTEGILTRMLQSDPGLSGIGAVIFDEFHERSLQADLGLALTLEVRAALREDLRLLVMSATLDAAPVAALMGNAPRITSEGRAFPVETRWLDRPLPPRARLEDSVATLVADAVAQTTGGVLVFLPGEGEIRRVEARLKDRLPPDCTLRPLFGAMPFADQRAAIAPVTKGRKVVLATSIAETSLTIEDIRVVVDAGLSRRARFDPGSGMSRLMTERVTKAEATQRRGRAGRVAPGTCFRMWTKGEEGGQRPFPPAEIEAADLADLVLELAVWGVSDPATLAFLTPPPPGPWAEAQALLTDLGAIKDGQITAHGRKLAAMPLHPRLAHMLAVSGRRAAPLAALLAERDPLPRSAPVDLSLRLEAITDPRRYANRHPWEAHRNTLHRIRDEAKRLAQNLPDTEDSPALHAARAFPDRIGLRRPGDAPRYVLSGGKGAVLTEGDPLSQTRLIVATDLDGDPREARIRQAIAISDSELRAAFHDRIAWHNICSWDKRARKVSARQQERLGALTLDDRIWRDAPEDAITTALIEGLRDLGIATLNWSPAATRFRARVALFDDLPDMSDETLQDTLETWLAPFLTDLRSVADLKRLDPLEALRSMLDWDQMQRLDRDAPAHFTTPLNRKIAIDYGPETPEIAVRLQEMFGVTTHPKLGQTPLRVTLLSPAGRALQTTTDLPGFWTSSYSDVRKDMRGRYPKHPWPEDPTEADPTLRAKPRR